MWKNVPFLSVCWQKNLTSSKSFGKASAPRQPDPTLRNERVGCLLVAVDVRGQKTSHSEDCPFTGQQVDGKEKEFAIFSCFVGTFETFHLGTIDHLQPPKTLKAASVFENFVHSKPSSKWIKFSLRKKLSHGVIMPCHVSGHCLDLVGPLWVPVPVHCASAHFGGGANPMFWVDILHCYRKFRAQHRFNSCCWINTICLYHSDKPCNCTVYDSFHGT